MTFLDFDFSDSDDGTASFEAMASVPASRWPELEREIMQLLAWARGVGECRALEEGGDWDFDLDLQRETRHALRAEPDWAQARLRWPAETLAQERFVATLTLSVCPALLELFRQRLGA